jgi:hypothetical protein
MSRAQAQARAANEARYGQILKLHQKNIDDVNKYQASVSNQQRQDIQGLYGQQSADMQQSMRDRGLYNTSVVNSLQAGLKDRESAELRRQSDQMIQNRLQAQLPMGAEMLRFMERRNDTYG